MPKQRGWGPSLDLFLPYLFPSIGPISPECSANSSIPPDSRLAMVERFAKRFFTKCFCSSFSLKGNIKSLKRESLHTVQTKALKCWAVSFFLMLLLQAKGFIYIILISKGNQHQWRSSMTVLSFYLGLHIFLAICYPRKLQTQIRDGKICNSDGGGFLKIIIISLWVGN